MLEQRAEGSLIACRGADSQRPEGGAVGQKDRRTLSVSIRGNGEAMALPLSTDRPVASTVSSFEADRGSFTLKQLGELLTIAGQQQPFL